MSGRTATMRITVLTVPDCPNTPAAIERITAALAGRPASVELVEVTGETEAARLGMTAPPRGRPRGPHTRGGGPAPPRRPAAEVLAELDREDFLTLGADGTIRAAYPFSATQTPHRVRISGGAEAWSMCAIDALGIPAMLGRDVVITSADPVTGATVTVTAGPGRSTVWEPRSAVVFLGSRSCPGPAATVRCGALNFL